MRVFSLRWLDANAYPDVVRSSSEAPPPRATRTWFHAGAHSGSSVVSSILAHALLDAAEARGARRQDVLAAAGCTLGDRARINGWLDLSQFSRMIEVVV